MGRKWLYLNIREPCALLNVCEAMCSVHIFKLKRYHIRYKGHSGHSVSHFWFCNVKVPVFVTSQMMQNLSFAFDQSSTRGCFSNDQQTVRAVKSEYISAVISNNLHKPQVLFTMLNDLINPCDDSPVAPSSAFWKAFLTFLLIKYLHLGRPTPPLSLSPLPTCSSSLLFSSSSSPSPSPPFQTQSNICNQLTAFPPSKRSVLYYWPLHSPTD